MAADLVQVKSEYPAAINVISDVAKRFFGYEFSDADLEVLNLLASVSSRVDSLYDGTELYDQRSYIACDVLRLLGGEVAGSVFDDVLARDIRRLGAISEENNASEFIGRVDEILSIGEIIFSLEDVRGLTDLIAREGEVTADLGCMLVPSMPERFKDFLKCIGRAGNIFDDLIDIHDDVDNGVRACTPGLRYYVTMGFALTKEVLSCFLIFPAKLRLVRFFVKFVASAIPKIISRRSFMPPSDFDQALE